MVVKGYTLLGAPFKNPEPLASRPKSCPLGLTSVGFQVSEPPEPLRPHAWPPSGDFELDLSPVWLVRVYKSGRDGKWLRFPFLVLLEANPKNKVPSKHKHPHCGEVLHPDSNSELDLVSFWVWTIQADNNFRTLFGRIHAGREPTWWPKTGS